MRKNTASQKIGAQIVSASTGAAFVGSVTVYVTGDAGTQAIGSVGSGACTSEGNGYFSYAPAQAETNYDLIAFTFIGSGAVPVTVQVFTTANLASDIEDAVTGQLGTTQPRINRRPDPGFTTQVSRRSDGTYKCTKPIRITAGTVSGVFAFIDMSPLFGAENYVETVGTPSVSSGSITASSTGPRDTYAIVELAGTATAGEERTVTVAVTMTSGTTLNVVFDLEVFE